MIPMAFWSESTLEAQLFLYIHRRNIGWLHPFWLCPIITNIFLINILNAQRSVPYSVPVFCPFPLAKCYEPFFLFCCCFQWKHLVHNFFLQKSKGIRKNGSLVHWNEPVYTDCAQREGKKTAWNTSKEKPIQGCFANYSPHIYFRCLLKHIHILLIFITTVRKVCEACALKIELWFDSTQIRLRQE